MNIYNLYYMYEGCVSLVKNLKIIKPSMNAINWPCLLMASNSLRPHQTFKSVYKDKGAKMSRSKKNKFYSNITCIYERKIYTI